MGQATGPDGGERVISFATALRAVLAALALFGVLMWPTLRVGEAYSVFFRTQANAFFGSSSKTHQVVVQPNTNRMLAGDSAIVVRWVQSRENRTSTFKSLFAFIPTALITALAIASPVPFRRRLAILWRGLLCIDLYVVLGTALAVAKTWYAHAPVCSQAHTGLFHAAWMQSLVRTVDAILFQEHSVNLLVPVVIWLWLAVPRDAWRSILGAARAK